MRRVAEGFDEGGLVDDLAAGDVDEMGGGLHQGELGGADQAAGGGVEAVVQGDEVGFGKEGFEGGDELDAEGFRDGGVGVG